LTGAAIFIFGGSTAFGGYVYHQGPGLIQAPIITQTLQKVGQVDIWNNKTTFQVRITPAKSWRIGNVKIYVGNVPVPATKKGNLIPGKFPYHDQFNNDGEDYLLNLNLQEDLGFSWGQAYEALRVQNIAIWTSMQKVDAAGNVIGGAAAWAYTGKGAATEEGEYDDALVTEFEGVGKGWWFSYLLSHPKRGHFVDSPVGGVTCKTPSATGVTDESGAFDYFPDEIVSLSLGRFSLGSTLANHKISPLDLFEQADTDSLQVINLARLLQSFDVDGDPKNGIRITPEIIGLFEAVMVEQGLSSLDFSNSDQIEQIISATVAKARASNASMQVVSAEDAKIHLDEQLSSAMFRKNVSKTPEMLTAKSKLELMPVLVPATKANGEAITEGIDYYDEDGNFLYNRTLVRPLVAVYADQIPETRMSDVFGAVSRDDGATWKRMNLSRAADRSSFTLANGQPYYGDVKKPNISVKGNYIFVAWQSKFARGGKPRYSLPEDDPNYVDDIYGVGGPQRSHDYTEDGFPEVGELPFYALWVARGTIDPATGDISWRKPERLTSGRRDVYQISINGANNVGYGVIWQEDPEGVRPGEMAGPGHGWSGATTNHKTDIWYSYIKWSDFAAIDENFAPKGDPEHAFDDPEWTTNRPMPLVPFTMPLRLSDNDVCNTDNMQVELGTDGFPLRDTDGKFIPVPNENATSEEADGTHRYCYMLDANKNGIPDLCSGFHTFTNSQGATKNVCVTEDGRLLDGDTGASRPNISFMPYSKTITGDNPATPTVETSYTVPSAWLAVAYEETKGVGGGRVEWDDDDSTTHEEEKDKADLGKNVIYHSFEFATPDKVSGGNIVNLPARDAFGNLLYLVDENGNQLLDWRGLPQLAYENARRPRMLVQPAGQAGSSGIVMAMVYKQGEDGKGRPSDIFMRRIKKPSSGNPYAFVNFIAGAQNLSSVTPVKYWTNPDQNDQAKGEGTKVVKYEQYATNLADASWTNPYEDARSHRGILRGNNLFFAYDYTPNWAASRNAHDKYDLFIRRSFDGGATWRTDPAPVTPADEVCHTRVWKDYTKVTSEGEANQKDTYEEVVCYAPGAYEPGRNMSQLKNNKLSVIEPRLVGPPSTTYQPGSTTATEYPEDTENKDVYYVTFGTATNVPKAHGNIDDEEEEESAVPADLFYTFSRDRGQSYFKRLWEVNPDSDGTYAGQTVERFDYLAKGDPEQGEAQIRMTPDGSRFYAVWNQDGSDGSDTWFRRVMSPDFPQNVSTPVAP
jgi:hypothetical protein